MATTFYMNGYIGWWYAVVIHFMYFNFFAIIFCYYSAVLRAQFPGEDIVRVRQRQNLLICCVEAVIIGAFLTSWVLKNIILT